MSASWVSTSVFNLRSFETGGLAFEKRLKPFVIVPAETTMSGQSSSVVGVIVAVLIIAAVGTLGYYQFEVAGKSTSTTSTGVQVTCPSSACVNVTMPSGAATPPSGWTGSGKTTFGFTPDSITVVIGKNNTVYWTNDDASIHTATSDTAGVFDTGNVVAGASAQWTFTTPGTYTYHCVYHAWMQGTITVKSG
jgi:plastocyanin